MIALKPSSSAVRGRSLSTGCIQSGKLLAAKKTPESTIMGMVMAFISPLAVSELAARLATSSDSPAKESAPGIGIWFSGPGAERLLRDRNLVFGSRSRTSPSRFGFGAETDFRPALSEFAESPSGCQRRFGLLSLVRARLGLPGGRAGRQEGIRERVAELKEAQSRKSELSRPVAGISYRSDSDACGERR